MINSDAWIQTHKGYMFRPFSEDWHDFDIEDIAHSLSNLCRFNGHCKEFYSVAQHSMLVSVIGGDGKQLMDASRTAVAQWGLLHDAPEAYLGDTSTPIKSSERLFLELKMLESIGKHFGLRKLLAGEKHIVSVADKRALATEKRKLMAVDIYWEALDGYPPLTMPLIPLAPKEAEKEFLQFYNMLFESTAAKKLMGKT